MAELIVSISGVRGIVGDSLRPEVGLEFGMAYGTFLRSNAAADKRPVVCIGRDSRPSGTMMARAVSAGVMAAGCNVIELGIVTTPGVGLMVRELGAAGGVVITASHNPIEYNGVKFLRNDGIAYPAEQVKKIQRHYFDKTFTLQDAVGVGQVRESRDTHRTHIGKVLGICDAKQIASKRLKVVLDSVNGAGCIGTALLLKELGCEVVHLNNEPTGHFAHRPEPVIENLTEVCPEVLKHKAVVGFVQDPDADRLALIDEKGTFIGEEYTFALAAKYVFAQNPGARAAANLSTSRMIDDIAAAAGGSVIRTPVGEAHVANAMQAENCVIGGEGNGGVIDLRVVPIRDSMVGIALILQLLAESGRKLSELVAEIPRYEMIKTKFPCEQAQAAATLERVKSHYADFDGAQVDTRDGIRVDLKEGWVQLRASNTEPIMRLMAESQNTAAAENLIDQVRQIAQL